MTFAGLPGLAILSGWVRVGWDERVVVDWCSPHPAQQEQLVFSLARTRRQLARLEGRMAGVSNASQMRKSSERGRLTAR